MTTIATFALNDGQELPSIGFGTYPLKGDNGAASILSALRVGYRLLDTAVNYQNEDEVGKALRRSGLPREDVRVTSKLPGRHHGYADAIASTQESLKRLGLDYLDLHLIHWPNPSQRQYVEAWRALVELRERGLVRSIGVSNFSQAHLERIIDDTGVTPAVNQVELHPYFPQPELRALHDELGIRTQAWSPLGKRQAPFDTEPIRRSAERHGVTPAQVILRWHHQLGSLPIPKATGAERQAENLDIFGFSLTEEEIAAISGLGRAEGRLFGGDPDRHEEM